MGGACRLRSMAEKRTQNMYTIHLCKQGKEFQKILDFAGLFRPSRGGNRTQVENPWCDKHRSPRGFLKVIKVKADVAALLLFFVAFAIFPQNILR